MLLAAKLDLLKTRFIKIDDLINVALRLHYHREPKPEEHLKWKLAVMECEMEVLIANNFDIDVDLPYKHLLKLAQHFPKEDPFLENIKRIAWSIINDW